MARGFKPQTISSDSALGAVKIQRSIRFNPVDNQNLTRTSSSTSTTFTYSVWIKRCSFSGYQYIFSMAGRGFAFHTNNQTLYLYDGNNLNESTAKFRDYTAWYHIVVQINSGVATSYVNGVLTHNAVGSGFTLTTGSNATRIGSYSENEYDFGGYMAEIHLVDGSVVAPTSFGFTDPVTGIWMPKRYEGTYGTDGFYLDFSDNSSTAALGIDKSPNGNDFTVNNFSVTAGKDDDSMIDTPTNNFPTFNLSNRSSGPTISNGNLRMYYNYKPASKTTRTTFRFPKSGKYYYEWQNEESSSNPGRWQSGIINVVNETSTNYDITGYNDADIVSYSYGGSTWFGTTHTAASWDGTTRSWYSPERAAWAVDCDTGNVWVGRVASDGTTQWWAPDGSATGNPSKFLNPTGQIDKDITHHYLPFMSWHDGGSASSTAFAVNINFGQHSFLGTVPDGFKTLSSANMPTDPTINTIVRPKKHFECIAYTGNGSTSGDNQFIPLEFDPDFVWIKSRGASGHNQVFDTIRSVGGDKALSPNQNIAEYAFSNFSFYNKGFDAPYSSSSSYTLNTNSATYVAWCWKAGGTAVTNNVGDITSSVSVNQEAGFSIVSYTGNGSNGQTVGHGLGKKPDWIILKARDAVQNWRVWHESLASDGSKRLLLDAQNASEDASFLNDTAPTSTVFTLGNADDAWNANSAKFIAYCWSEIPGYSKFGTYTGNGSTDGTYVHLGFRPAFVITKQTNSTGSWFLFDNKRSGYNETEPYVMANVNNVEATDLGWDLLSDGFKLRNSYAQTNGSASTYIYMAFAEEPGTTPFDAFPNAR